MKTQQILLSLSLSLALSTLSFGQNFDTTGLSTWPNRINSYTTWEVGAFDAYRDANNPSDFGWGEYNITTHFIEGDSIYILKTTQGDYKAISIDQLASGVFTISYSNLDGSQKVTQTLDRSAYAGKNFFYYDLSTEQVKDLEPINSQWDVVFTKYLITFPGFGAYPVTGLLHNRDVRVAQVEKDPGQAPQLSDTAQFPFSDNISTIGYDWKSAGPTGIIIRDTLFYYVEDQAGNINLLELTQYGGSGTGDISFTVNGQSDSISLSPGNGNQVYYSLQQQQAVQTNTDQQWDLAFFAQSSFSAIPVRINDVNGTELYVYPNEDISHWNTVGLEEETVQILSLYPNPARELVTLALGDAAPTAVEISLRSMDGRTVQTWHKATRAGLSEWQLSLQDVPGGVYVLTLKGKQWQASRRLVVQP